jgi:hypothetical protein
MVLRWDWTGIGTQEWTLALVAEGRYYYCSGVNFAVVFLTTFNDSMRQPNGDGRITHERLVANTGKMIHNRSNGKICAFDGPKWFVNAAMGTLPITQDVVTCGLTNMIATLPPPTGSMPNLTPAYIGWVTLAFS